MTTITDIYDEFAVLVTAFAAAQGVTVSYPAISFVAPDTGEWLELLVFWNGSENYGVGNGGPSIENGFFRLVVNSRSQGVMAAQKLAEEVVTAFRKGTTFAGARVESMPSIGGPFQEDDKIIVPVTITWRASR